MPPIATFVRCGKLTRACRIRAWGDEDFKVITIDNVTKRFYSLIAVDGVSFTVPRGRVVGVLGPNGAGKTTLFKLIAGFLNPDSGEVRPTYGYWPAIGYKPERLLFPNQLRVDEYLVMIARLSSVPRHTIDDAVHEALAEVKLLESAGKRIGQCSKGMRQRLGLAQSLIGAPPMLILDEPSNGLDPEGQSDIQRLIRRVSARSQTILMSSHQLQEVTQTCDYLIILNRGRIHYKGTMAEALALRPHVTIQVDRDLEPATEILTTLHHDIEIDGRNLILINEAIRLRRQILSILVGMGFDIIGVAQKRRTLEEIYAEAVQWHDES